MITTNIVRRIKAISRTKLHGSRNFVSLMKLLWNQPMSQISATKLKSEEVQEVFFTSDSLKIVGDLLEPDTYQPSPAILLLHGTSRYGRKLPLIQILARKFYKLGYIVLAIDLRGYGESEVPEALTSPRDFDFAQDVHSAIEFLVQNTRVDPEEIYVLGHSFGAGVALAAQCNNPLIKKLILFGPPRRLSERFLNPGAPDRDFILARMRRDMNLPYNLDFQIWKHVVAARNIETYIEQFSQTQHIPLFLIDSEYENPLDLNFLRDIYRHLKGQVEYWTVPQVDHYLNTSSHFGFLLYSEAIINQFTQRIDLWLNSGTP